MSSVERLLKEAEQLPEDQRLTLAHRLLEYGEPPVTEEVEKEWDLVIRERVRRFDEGESHTRPAGEVFADLDRRLAK